METNIETFTPTTLPLPTKATEVKSLKEAVKSVVDREGKERLTTKPVAKKGKPVVKKVVKTKASKKAAGKAKKSKPVVKVSAGGYLGLRKGEVPERVAKAITKTAKTIKEIHIIGGGHYANMGKLIALLRSKGHTIKVGLRDKGKYAGKKEYFLVVKKAA